MPEIFPVISRTRDQASVRFEELQDLIHPRPQFRASPSSSGTTCLPTDVPTPDLPDSVGHKSRQQILIARRAKHRNGGDAHPAL